MNRNSLKFYLFPSIILSQRNDNSILDADGKGVVYSIAFVSIVIVAIVFLLGYFVQHETWDSALSIGLLITLPFLLAFSSIGLVGIAVMVTLVIVSYIIDYN